MKRRRITLIVLIVLALALAALYAGLKLGGAADDAESQTAAAVSLVAADKESIRQLSYTYEGETITLVRGDAGWQLADDAAFPLNADTVALMLSSISAVSSTIPVEQGDDSLFGLDTPSLTVTVTLADGSEQALTLGDLNGFNNRYYARGSGSDGIYMVDGKYYRYFAYTLNQLAAPDSLPVVRSANVTGVTLTSGDNVLRLAAYDTAAPQVYSDDYAYVTPAPDGSWMGAEPNAAAAIVSLVSGLSTTDCYRYGATEADFTACGLDGSRTITLDYVSAESGSAGSWTLTVGDTTEDGASVYVRVGDSSMICRMAADTVPGLLTLTADQVRSAEVCALSLSEVDAMTLTTADGARTTFTVERPGAHTANYFMDGVELASDAYKSFFTTITTLAGTGFAETAEGGTLLLRVDFTRSTEAYAEVTLALYDLGDGTCRAEFAGLNTRLVARESVDTILTALAALG